MNLSALSFHAPSAASNVPTLSNRLEDWFIFQGLCARSDRGYRSPHLRFLRHQDDDTQTRLQLAAFGASMENDDEGLGTAM
jgi:hypothetical protein